MANFGFSIDTAANWKSNNPTPNADEMCMESDTRFVKVGDGSTAWNSLSYLVTDPAVSGIYGDGSDGNVTISGTITLSRDMFYDTLTVNSPGVLVVNGWRVFCKTACIVASGGTIQANGLAATSTTGAVASGNAGFLGFGSAGGAGGATTGTAGTNRSNTVGGQGGTGGTGSSGAGAAGGTATAVATSSGGVRTLPTTLLGAAVSTFNANIVTLNGGTGGGGGGGDGTAGGGGGAGGNVLILAARTIANSGVISANGGDGFAAAAGNRGGGGGGGGGAAFIHTASLIGTTPTANGGAGGARTGTGTAGAAGAAGTVIVNVLA